VKYEVIQMKRYALIALVFAFSILTTLFIASVYAQTYNWNLSHCTHLHVGGVNYEWSCWDEVAGCGIGANYISGSYVSEYLSFRRNVAYALAPEAAVSNFLCYMWMGPAYNYWPYQYSNQEHPNWQYQYLYNTVNPPPNGQWYHYQDYWRYETWTTSEIYVMADQWFRSPLLGGYGVWECYAWVHAPVGGGQGNGGGTWG
jgi:hypothetical protein